MHVGFVGHAFAFFAHYHIEVLLGFGDHFFDAGGVNATVFEQFTK